MSRFVRYLLSKPLLFGIVLAAVVLRGLVPAGYMPAPGEAFTLQMCRVGLPTDAPSDTGAPQSDSHEVADSSCSFGSAPAAGPASSSLKVWIPPPVSPPAAISADVSVVFHRPYYDRQARAPPVLS